MRRSHVLPTLGLALALSAVNLHARSAPPAGGPALTPVSSNRPALTPGNGKLLLTGGVSSIDGAAGGGLTPWAMVGSYATTGEFGGIAFITHATTQTDTLARSGASAGFDDCFELSLARQEFNASVVVPDTALRLDIVGIKLRVAGDAVLDSVAAKRDGVDLYASATKLFLAPGILVNGQPARQQCEPEQAARLRLFPTRWLPAGTRAIGRLAAAQESGPRCRMPFQAEQPGLCRRSLHRR